MHRYLRLLALPIALTAVAVLAIGGAVARLEEAGSPGAGVELSDEADEATASNVERIVERLDERAGIETDADAFNELAGQLGVGGAVRSLLWADAAGMSAAEIAALREEMGWGKIRKTLDPDGELGLHPGIGWVMGNGGDDDEAGETGQGRPDDPGAHGRARAAEAKDKGSDD